MAPFDISELKGRVNAGRASIVKRYESVREEARPSPSPRPPPVPPVASTSAPPIPRRSQPTPSPALAPRINRPIFTEQDKMALFGLLDSYFDPQRRTSSSVTQPPPQPTPPPIRNATRPVISSPAPPTPTVRNVAPDPSDCQARACAESFLPSNHWSNYWFDMENLPPNTAPTPPFLEGRADAIHSVSWSSMGNQKSLQGIALFEDLSITYFHLTWTHPSSVQRSASYTPSPTAWSRPLLLSSSNLYGPPLASFAESALYNRTHIGRGECWDLAHEGLESLSSVCDPKPMASIGRTHGHLIYTARVGGGGGGMWRGGDDSIRRGDIVQWRTTRIKLVDQPHMSMTLGDPDHTAIIVSDSVIPSLLSSQRSEEGTTIPLEPSALGRLDVIEQNVRELPTRRVYDMRTFSAGEVWIYRPVSMEGYLGMDQVTPVWPPPPHAQRVC